MQRTVTIPHSPNVTVAFKAVPSSEQRFRAIQVYLSLARCFEELENPAKAEHWKKQARLAGWKEEFEL